jgi:hypothetical protein
MTWKVMYFWREIQIILENIFDAMNFKNINDDYSGKIGIKSKWSFFFLGHFIGNNMTLFFF